jgi:hypothetical protein
MTRRAPALLLAIGLLTVSAATPAAAQEGTAQVTVVHAFRGLVADVYVDGERQLEGFAPERLAGPLAMPAGRHEVAVYEAGQGPPAEPALAATLDIEAGTNVSVVVHAGEDGQPRAAVFPNDLGRLPAGAGRVVVRNTAGVAPLDVVLDGAPVAQGVASGEEAAQQLAAGAHQAAVTASGQPLLPPADVTVDDGAATVLYLIGAQDSLGWLTQTIQATPTSPGGVPTGTSGLAAESTSGWLLAGPVVALALLGGMVLVRRRAGTTRG